MPTLSRAKMHCVLAVVAFMLFWAGMVMATQSQEAPAAALPGPLEALSEQLHEALVAENLAEADALLAAGADPNWLDPGGKTAMHRAAFADNPDLLDIVLAHGGDPNARGLSGTVPLDDAVLTRSHSLEKVETLLAAGADPNSTDPNGGTPLHTAARTNNGRAILALLNAGAWPLAETGGATFQTFYFGYSPAILNDRALAERRAVVDWLLQNGIPLEPHVDE